MAQQLRVNKPQRSSDVPPDEFELTMEEMGGQPRAEWLDGESPNLGQKKAATEHRSRPDGRSAKAGRQDGEWQEPEAPNLGQKDASDDLSSEERKNREAEAERRLWRERHAAGPGQRDTANRRPVRDSEGLKANRRYLNVNDSHKTPAMERGHRGSFP